MRYAGLLLLSLIAACSGDDISVRQRFLAQSSVSVQFEGWVRSLNNQNQDSLALVFHQVPELRVLHTDGTVARGRDEVREAQVEFFDSAEMVNFVPDGLEIEVLGDDVVLTTFRYTLDIERTDGTRDPTVRGLGTIVWTNDPADGLWKIRALQLSARRRPGS
jgi:ketosteroid isomerase-like protein